MTAEYPKAHLWNTSKSFIDYTWCVTAGDWMGAVEALDYEERRKLGDRCGFIQLQGTPKQRAAEIAKSCEHWPKQFGEWEIDKCYWDWVYALTGAEKPVLESLTDVGPEQSFFRGLAVPSLPAHVMAGVDAWIHRRLGFTHEWELERRGRSGCKGLEEP